MREKKRTESSDGFWLGAMKNFVYLIVDWSTKVAAIVDPQFDIATPLAALESQGIRLGAIFLTHTHHDHIAGVPALLEKFPELPVRVHERDQHRLGNLPRGARIESMHDLEIVKVGTISVEIMHTPGHSAGECCYLIRAPKPYLFTGDTVFIRDCGRTDFPDGSNEEMFSSLQRIKKLPPETVLLPGHHYAPECATTLDAETRTSAPMRCKSVRELAALP